VGTESIQKRVEGGKHDANSKNYLYEPVNMDGSAEMKNKSVY